MTPSLREQSLQYDSLQSFNMYHSCDPIKDNFEFIALVYEDICLALHGPLKEDLDEETRCLNNV